MSLELALQENTAAVNALAALIAKLDMGAAPAAKATKPVAEKAPKAEPTPEPVAAEPAATKAEPEAPTVTTEQAIELLKKVIAAKGRDTGVALLTEFGVAKLGLLSADKLPAFAAKAEEALA